MSYTNRSGDQRQPDMPAVSPLDMPVGADQPKQPRRRIAPKSPRQVLQPETAPPPPPRSQKARHPLVVVMNFFIMVVVLVVLASGAAFYFGSKRFSEPGPLAQATSVLVQPGSDLDSIAAQLERNNVIDNPFIFSTAVRFFYKAEDKLRAGEYLFQANASMEQVLDDLLSGRSVLHALTFPEGWTSQAIVDKLNADPVLTGDITTVPPEGSLMPETYKFTRGRTRQEVVDEMQRLQTRTVEDIWGRRAPGLPIETQEEFVVLASIVEKETGRADERPRVASVFINRLREGMRRNPIRQCSMGSSAERGGRPTGRSTSQTWRSRRPSTPTRSQGCRRRRSRIPVAQRSKPWPIHRGRKTSTSSRTALAAMCFLRIWRSITATSRAGGRSAQRGSRSKRPRRWLPHLQPRVQRPQRMRSRRKQRPPRVARARNRPSAVGSLLGRRFRLIQDLAL